ncbi:Spaf_1101 family AAA-like ATPase [Aerococcaceae bacterium 50-4]
MEENRRRAYFEINSHRQKSGKYRKSLIHIHTPASYDFKLSKSLKNYNEISEKTIFRDYVINEFGDTLSMLFKDFELTQEFLIFKNRKEFYSYLLLGKRLLEEGIEMAVVSDHNTLDGHHKLELVIKHLLANNNYVHCNIVKGIELSCADRMHVVIIFDEEKKMQVEDYLMENLISEKDGVIRTSFDVLEHFNSKNGFFAYIAHINSSNLFNATTFLSGGYRKKLLNSKHSEYVGVSGLDSIEKVEKRLSRAKMKRNFILDCDSHGIDDFDGKYVWVKSADNTTSSMMEAIKEYEVSILLEEPQVPSNYIVGIWIQGGPQSFLKSKNDIPFSTTFSPSLNSFIGGRGTGKSTILDVIDFMLTQNFNNKEHLYFLSKLGTTIVLVQYKGEKYLIESFLPESNNPEMLIAMVNEDDYEKYSPEVSINHDKLKRNLIKNHLDIYKIDGNKFKKITSNKYEFLNLFYDSKYSVNKLVNIAGTNKISDFLYDMLIKGNKKNMEIDFHISNAEDGINYLEAVEKLFTDDKKLIEQILQPFNDDNQRIFEIVYEQNFQQNNGFLSQRFIFEWDRIVNTYDITTLEIYDYLYLLGRKKDVVQLFKEIIKKDYDSFPSITQFARQNRQANLNLITINNNNSKLVIEKIFDNFLERNVLALNNFFEDNIQNFNKYSIKFNVNAFDFDGNRSEFKDISVLSLGQKVVAMLTVIFNYGKYSEETKPIIIDQPEDNLDNRYIYTNLVTQLKNLKAKRQVIIATHSSTIVTNSLVENVIVMESNGKHGWIKSSGYTLNKRIKKDILNILEGGRPSFSHRKNIYNNVLKDNHY